jgi:rod shape-determining protein MreC
VKNIFLFIRNRFNILTFLILQGVCIAILVKYNKTHEAIFANNANEVTGWVNTKYNFVENYFSLTQSNKQLLEENARLKNQLAASFDKPDSTHKIIIDSLLKDTTGRIRKYITLPAKVVGNSVTSQSNFITLYRGSSQGVKKEMAVVGPQGIVGKVVEVSANYSVVMSLLHSNSTVKCMLKKDNSLGKVEWDGKSPEYVTLKNILKSTKVAKGDTVLTSNLSGNFPSGLMVGTIADIAADPASNFFTLKVKTATNFSSLQYAYLIENLLYAEQKQIEEKAAKKNNE